MRAQEAQQVSVRGALHDEADGFPRRAAAQQRHHVHVRAQRLHGRHLAQEVAPLPLLGLLCKPNLWREMHRQLTRTESVSSVQPCTKYISTFCLWDEVKDLVPKLREQNKPLSKSTQWTISFVDT